VSPEFLLFVALALGLMALSLRLDDHEAERRDARRRNPRTWDDEA